MSNRESKRSSICRADIIACAECDVVSIPGNSNISVSGVWEKLNFSSVEFSEKPTSDSSSYDVSIDFSFSDTGHDNYIHLMTWCNIYVLIKLSSVTTLFGLPVSIAFNCNSPFKAKGVCNRFKTALTS